MSDKSRVILERLFPRWITLASFCIIVLGLLLLVLSRNMTDPFLKDVLLGIGLALAPSGLLVFLMDWLIFGRLIDTLRERTEELRLKTKSLESEVNSLRVSTEFLSRSSSLGLEMIYANRAVALGDFRSLMVDEAKKKDGNGSLIIIGSSIKGLLETVGETTEIIEEALKHDSKVNILLTHPQYSQYRENQEDRPTGAIEDEIFDGIRQLEAEIGAHNVAAGARRAPTVKLYKGTPTCFMIIAGSRMLINPYPYEEEAYKSFCIAVRRVDPIEPAIDPELDLEYTIYEQYRRAHYEKPWERNSLPYRYYWLQGPNPEEKLDRDSCYGDVFIVQDASDFYFAIYLLGRRIGNVRGMPTSIPYGDLIQKDEFIQVPDAFSIKLYSARDKKWESLDDGPGILELHPGRRRGKVSGKIRGNLLNDYLMLGLFDQEGGGNPYSNPNSLSGAWKDEKGCSPLFFASLCRESQSQDTARRTAAESEGEVGDGGGKAATKGRKGKA